MVDLDNIYKIPEVLSKEGFDDLVVEQFGLACDKVDLEEWRRVINAEESATEIITVGMVGKYLDHSDAYKSLNEAMRHAGIPNNVKVKIVNIDSESLEKSDDVDQLAGVDAILVPGGFGDRGFEGKIKAVQYARENKVPYLGICYGMHAVVIEYARNICNLDNATTTENDIRTPHPVIALITQWEDHLGQIEVRDTDSDLGGTMRLGLQKSLLKKGSLVSSVYGSEIISERHRHRYEFNNAYRDVLEKNGLILSATSEDGELIEMVELSQDKHPWFVACQFHPEFTSTPRDGHPLFAGFVKAAIDNK
jgi:CTP synthase